MPDLVQQRDIDADRLARKALGSAPPIAERSVGGCIVEELPRARVFGVQIFQTVARGGVADEQQAGRMRKACGIGAQSNVILDVFVVIDPPRSGGI